MWSVIFAGRNRIIMIRRELPLTVIASPVRACRIGQAGVLPSCLPWLLLTALCSRWMSAFIYLKSFTGTFPS